ncbi:hypothetical protein QQ008_28710 [Fulvivirgaceae bacterium BMA10]|uniref:Uncharacterized protein n=1 Tax=Splendidivirga corallicola TaxID=3051826 RepID=A0ABT8KX66_9BACT|nr:hypothetical protein [Fulvivirgaceae bacterium BMA10]
MDIDKEQLTNEKSLEIITNMIAAAKGKVDKNSFYFLLWGWVCVLANIGHYYILKFTDYPEPQIVWVITIPAAIVSAIYGYFQRKRASVKTHLGTIAFWIWMAFLISLVLILIFAHRINYQINPMIMILTASATFISGIILRFKPLIIGGILFWVFAVLALLSSLEYQYLIGAIALITGYLIPGYMLKKRANNG